MNVKFVVDLNAVMRRKSRKYLWAAEHANETVSLGLENFNQKLIQKLNS